MTETDKKSHDERGAIAKSFTSIEFKLFWFSFVFWMSGIFSMFVLLPLVAGDSRFSEAATMTVADKLEFGAWLFAVLMIFGTAMNVLFQAFRWISGASR